MIGIFRNNSGNIYINSRILFILFFEFQINFIVNLFIYVSSFIEFFDIILYLNGNSIYRFQ